MTSPSILVRYWLPKALKMPHNLATLLDEVTSPKIIGVKSTRL
jgi:hypothetical protein